MSQDGWYEGLLSPDRLEELMMHYSASFKKGVRNVWNIKDDELLEVTCASFACAWRDGEQEAEKVEKFANEKGFELIELWAYLGQENLFENEYALKMEEDNE